VAAGVGKLGGRTMRAVALLVIGRPRTVLAAAALLTLLALWTLTAVSFDNSTERLLVRDSEAWRLLVSVRDTFGGDETLFVLLRAPDVMAPEAIRIVGQLTSAVAGVPGVERVVSLTGLRWPWADAGSVVVKPLFDARGEATPGAPVERALSHPLVLRNLVSADHRVTAILALVSPHPEDPHFKGRLVANVAHAAEEAAPGADVTLGGAPVAQVALNELTAHDLRVLGPLALLVMAAVLFLTYRDAHGVWLPLLAVAVSLLWTIALAAVLGRSLSIVSSVLPPLILAIGTSYTIRVLSEHRRQRATQPDRVAALLATLDEVGITVLLCGATTALGFGALLTSRVEVIRDLGLLAMAGAGLTTLAALTVVPAALALLPSAGGVRAPSGTERRLQAALLRLHAFTAAHGGALLGAAALVTGIGLVGLSFLAVDQDPYAWFPPDSPVARSTHVVDDALGGVVPLAVVLESRDGVFDPALLRAADKVARWVRVQPEARAVVSPADHLRLIDGAFTGEPRGRLPDTRKLTAQYMLLYDTGDPATLAPYVSEAAGRVQVVVRLAHASSRRLRAFVARLTAELPTLAPAPLVARVTGTGLLRLETNDEFTNGLVRNLLLASLAMAALLALTLRSARLGLLALVPNLLPILVVYGVLGWLAVPLNAATVTTGAAALGNAVDDTVQYLDRYRRRRSAGLAGVDARRETLLGVGIPMVASDVVLMAGFCLLVCSRFFPVASLGLLGATAMGLSLVANLFVLPVLVARSEGQAPHAPGDTFPPA
jgi:hypothetical protein